MDEKPKPKIKVESPFRRWVKEQGSLRAAKRIGVTDRALRAWLAGDYFPSIKLMDRIVKLSHGQLTIEQIMSHVIETAKAKGKTVNDPRRS